MKYYQIVVYIAIATTLIPLGVAAIQWKKIPHDIASLRWLLIASLIADLVGTSLAKFGIKNHLVGNLYMVVQFTILLYIFSQQFERKTIFKIVYAVALVLCGVLLLLGDGAVALVRSGAVDGLILIVVSLALFYKLLDELKVVGIHRLPILWIAFGTLVYYSGNFFLFLARNYLEQDPDMYTKLWTWVHNGLNVTKNLLFATALWQSYRTIRANHE